MSDPRYFVPAVWSFQRKGNEFIYNTWYIFKMCLNAILVWLFILQMSQWISMEQPNFDACKVKQPSLGSVLQVFTLALVVTLSWLFACNFRELHYMLTSVRGQGHYKGVRIGLFIPSIYPFVHFQGSIPYSFAATLWPVFKVKVIFGVKVTYIYTKIQWCQNNFLGFQFKFQR